MFVVFVHYASGKKMKPAGSRRIAHRNVQFRLIQLSILLEVLHVIRYYRQAMTKGGRT